MLDRIIFSVANEAWETKRSRAGALADGSNAHSRFSQIVNGDDPRLNPIWVSVYRHLSKPTEPDDQKVADIDSSGISAIHRLCHSLYTQDETQFENLSRIFWLLDSFSSGLRRSGLFDLNSIGALNQRTSLEDFLEK